MKPTTENQNELMRAYYRILYDLFDLMETDLSRSECLEVQGFDNEAIDCFFKIAKIYIKRERAKRKGKKK